MGTLAGVVALGFCDELLAERFGVSPVLLTGLVPVAAVAADRRL